MVVVALVVVVVAAEVVVGAQAEAAAHALEIQQLLPQSPLPLHP